MSVDGPSLRDIHLPSAAWWPLAPGWWVVVASIVLLVVVAAWSMRRRKRHRPLAMALQEIDVLAATFARNGDTAELADGASRLLRRVGRKVDPAIASRSGEAWRTFVQAHAHDADVRATLDGLLDARFRARPVLDAPALLAALRAWCGNALRHGKPSGKSRDGKPGNAATGEAMSI